MRFGAAYYPEHWPRERWPLDAAMMRDAGFNTVRLAEFAWTRMEPREGEFDFDWLDEAIGLLGRHGIQTLLCTPTATPPGWVVEQSPEILPVDAEGRIIGFGGRRHYCPTNPSYREHVERIVTAMGRRYADHPDVIAWQIDNELACHMPHCYCNVCQTFFQRWLRQEYETLDVLNEAWGTDFWSELFTDWSQIPAPRYLSTAHNYSLVLAWKRYYTEVWTNYFTVQATLLRNAGVEVPITTNLMGLFPEIDYYTHAEALDFVAWDNYPSSFPAPAAKAESALAADLMRSIKDGAPYWIVEQQSGAPGWQEIGGRTGPGYLRLMAYQGFAHGGEGVLFFRWRTCRFGVEQYWHGILQHDGRPNWRYHEVAALGRELRALPEDLFTARTPAQVAILYSHDQLWAHQLQPHVKGFNYQRAVMPAYRAVRAAGLDVALVNEESDLNGYRLLIAPAWQLVPPDMAERVIDFVRGGGTLVLTFRSGVKDWENVIFEDPLPGPLRDLMGLTIDDYDALGAQDLTVPVDLTDAAKTSGRVTGSLWADLIAAEEARVAGVFADGGYAGRPAITVNTFGAGQAWYLGTQLGDEFWMPFAERLRNGLNLPPALATSPGVEIARRQGQQLYTFVMNMQAEEGWVEVTEPCTDLLSGERLWAGHTPLAAYGVRILA